MRTNILILFFLAIVFTYIGFSCERTYVDEISAGDISFSTDTLQFDTIFTDIGSSTQSVVVYNSSSNNYIIDHVYLAGGDDSPFNVNVNGLEGAEFSDVFINGNDSLYVFVNVLLNQSADILPYMKIDSLIFDLGTTQEKLYLQAFGQNVQIVDKLTITGDTTFTAELPYYIYDTLKVANGASLSIDEGVSLYFYNEGHLNVEGTIKVNGTEDKPVRFVGHRTEEWYNDVSNQWGGITIEQNSSDSYIRGAEILNSKFGIKLNSVGISGSVPIELSNIRIDFVGTVGLLSQNSRLEAYNLLIANCGSNSIQIINGGFVNIAHSTIANYRQVDRSDFSPTVYIDNIYNDSLSYQLKNSQVNIYNSIIYGNLNNELFIDTTNSNNAAYTLKNCLLKIVEQDSNIGIAATNDLLLNSDPYFEDVVSTPFDYNYRIKQSSDCINTGNVSIGHNYPTDFDGVSRVSDEAPDIGAYEYTDDE